MPVPNVYFEMMYFVPFCQASTLAKSGVSPQQSNMTRKPKNVANVRPDVPCMSFFCPIFATVLYHRTKAWHLIP